jgi:hypothetical protein
MGYPDISVVTDFDSKNPDKGFPVLLMGYVRDYRGSTPF